jgi:hypothetical protein
MSPLPLFEGRSLLHQSGQSLSAPRFKSQIKSEALGLQEIYNQLHPETHFASLFFISVL